MASFEEFILFPHKQLGHGRRASVVTVRRAQDNSGPAAAGFVNLQVPPAARLGTLICGEAGGLG